MSKKTKLRKINLTSVDMVRRGANQEAYINLYKSAGDPAEPQAASETPPGTPGAPNPNEIPSSLWKSIKEAVTRLMKASEAQGAELDDAELDGEESQQEIMDNRTAYNEALNKSIDSILADGSLSTDEKADMITKSIEQFSEAYTEECVMLLKATDNTDAQEDEPEDEEYEGDPQDEYPESKESEGEEEMKIDKSRFTPEELAQYNALITKGMVEDDPAQDGATEPAIEKSAEMHPEVKKALEDMEALKKSMEMKEMAGIAKKYAPLGKKEDELAQTLYDMKKSSEASYDAYLAVLDQNLDLVNKSGLFEEIGKSSRGVAGGSTLDKIEGIATELQKSDVSLDRHQAIAKAWENHPELVAEYDEEYQK